MRIRACAFALLLAASTTLHVMTADAQSSASDDAFTEMARKRFQEGVRLYDQKRYDEARAAFLQAYALKKHPAVLLNLAQSELRSGHPVEAARHFAEFLRDNPDAAAAEQKSAQEGLASARTQTGRLEVTVNVPGADVYINGEAVGRAPLPEAVDVVPGLSKVEVKLPGYEPVAAEATTAAGGVAPVRLTMVPEGGVVAAPVPEEEQAPVQEPTEVAVGTSVRQPFFEWVAEDEVAWVTGGVTVVGVVLGTIFSLATRNASNNADHIAGRIKSVAAGDEALVEYQGADRRSNPCADPIPEAPTDYRRACAQLQDNLDKRETDMTIATAGWVVGGVGAAVTAVFYFVRSEPHEAQGARETPANSTVVAPVLGPGFQGMAIGGTF